MPVLESAAGRLNYFDSSIGGGGDPAAPCALLLHSSAASHRQWRLLIEQMTPRWRVLAPDLVGYGGTPVPSTAAVRGPTMDDEVALLAALLDQVDGPVHVVGHSYGGAVALDLARARPLQVASLALYEPAAFLTLRYGIEAAAWREIALIGQRHIGLVEARNATAAAIAFLDYWIAGGALRAMPDTLQAYVIGCMPKVAAEFRQFLQLDDSRLDFAALTMPALLLCGSETTLAARGVIAELRRRLPAPRVLDLPGLGHMAPLLQPDLVNPAIQDFLSTAALCIAAPAGIAARPGTGMPAPRFIP